VVVSAVLSKGLGDAETLETLAAVAEDAKAVSMKTSK
jgi:hypothetical protein